MAVQVFIHRINIIEAVEGGGRIGRLAEFFLERSQLLQRAGIVPADFFIRGEDRGGGRLVALGQVGLGHELVGVRGINVVRIHGCGLPRLP